MRERLSRGRLKLQHCCGDGEAPEKCEAFGIGTGAPTRTAQTPHRGLKSRGDNHSKVEGWRSVCARAECPEKGRKMQFCLCRNEAARIK